MRHLLLLAATAGLTACAAGLPMPPVPAALRPVTPAQVTAWVAATRPTRYQQIYFHFHFDNGKDAGGGGHGIVRIAPPDSIALGYSSPFGAKHGAGFVLGDSLVWGQPEDDVRKIVPNYPLFWAMLGVARPPASETEIRGIDDARVRAWRYVDGSDTVVYVRTKVGTAEFRADVQQNGKPFGRVLTMFDAAGRPTRARLDILTTPSRLDITFDSVRFVMSFPKDTWNAPPQNQ